MLHANGHIYCFLQPQEIIVGKIGKSLLLDFVTYSPLLGISFEGKKQKNKKKNQKT